MLRRWSNTILILVLILIGITLHGEPNDLSMSISYWLWAGITAKDAPANSELYIFQGDIYTKEGKTSYERQGLYPHPIKSSKLFLVYRLEGELPNAKDVIDIFQHSVARWQRHPVSVSGMQIDFDSPTSKLAEYSRFLNNIRKELPEEYSLSITGLCDWATSGNQEAMRLISSSTDEIVFQLYQGRDPLQDIEKYIRVLAEYQRPFRIGLISGSDIPASVNTLKSNSNYRGIIYFIQKVI
jgi:hypothetical protein